MATTLLSHMRLLSSDMFTAGGGLRERDTLPGQHRLASRGLSSCAARPADAGLSQVQIEEPR